MAHPRHDLDGYHFLHNAPVNFSWVDTPWFGHPLLPLWLQATLENTAVFFLSLSAPSHLPFWFHSSSLLYSMSLFISPASYLLGSQFAVETCPLTLLRMLQTIPASLCLALLPPVFLLLSNSPSSSFLPPSLLVTGTHWSTWWFPKWNHLLAHITSRSCFSKVNRQWHLLLSPHSARSAHLFRSILCVVCRAVRCLFSWVFTRSHPPSCFSHSPGPLLAISYLELSPQGWLPDPPSRLASHLGSGSIIGLGIDSSARGCRRCLPHCSGWMLDLDSSAFLSFIPGHSPIHLIYDDSLSDSFFLFHHYGPDSSCCHLLPEQWWEASASLHSILLCSLLLVRLGKPRPGAEECPRLRRADPGPRWCCFHDLGYWNKTLFALCLYLK